MSSKQKPAKANVASARPLDRGRVVYSEFGNADNTDALKRAVPDLPPNQQSLRVEASRAGRKGKTVTIIRGFQASQETLTDLLKTLKAHCGAGGTLKENELELQGDHKQKIVEFLLKLGYKAKGSGG
ncbi:translation initiation factor [Phormidium sp. FACHB-592]|uniref:Translation initiation factor n=1 Tax=Stenomitos frigidus AS-A4 TaxID=2933935 RepID=A0ABV0KD72_9CYAN|nr:translation initiation factor [Phormidium sp. FACHB-592]MBD2077778.1 translation initiation factor [Phormidium sp. FACHB-592]